MKVRTHSWRRQDPLHRKYDRQSVSTWREKKKGGTLFRQLILLLSLSSIFTASVGFLCKLAKMVGDIGFFHPEEGTITHKDRKVGR